MFPFDRRDSLFQIDELKARSKGANPSVFIGQPELLRIYNHPATLLLKAPMEDEPPPAEPEADDDGSALPDGAKAAEAGEEAQEEEEEEEEVPAAEPDAAKQYDDQKTFDDGTVHCLPCDKDRIRPFCKKMWQRKANHFSAGSAMVRQLYAWRYLSHMQISKATPIYPPPE